MNMKRKDYIFVRFIAFSVLYTVVSIAILLIAFKMSWETPWFYIISALFVVYVSTLVLGYHLIWKPYIQKQKITIEQFNKYLDNATTLEVSKRQAQYIALQNQINPHFLYNTLESIRSEALMSGLNSVAVMCESLANYFRYTISNLNDIVTLEEEIKNIQTYFFIQKYRFGDRLQLVIECDEDEKDLMMEYQIPKLTLQPIVENAIIHGIEQKIGNGIITIRMMLTEQRLIINVLDNGVGMSKETIEKVNRQINEKNVSSKGKGGIAISNVNNRIKLLFGELYGVTVFSTEGVGTEVEITLPRSRKKATHSGV
jgi:two-component system sensor histidine kinase YesM